jgi:very-short-patch-repair endonuclease
VPLQTPNSFARGLRRTSTDAERKVWQLLRSRTLAGYKFRRQQPIDSFVVDFCCLRSRLVIELDGGQHAEKIEYDQRRTDYLVGQGFRVLRFWDHEVFENQEGVLSQILQAVSAPSPQPSPETGEGEVNRVTG